ncbi:ATP-binding protein [Pantoea sp. B65]|uniref:ATP-binding protein n=1 Tax=Pantoea sp. B65 TaxID=2813359 RepID=UPI0039B575EB
MAALWRVCKRTTGRYRLRQHRSWQLAAACHELRTPLSGVLGALELLQAAPLNDHQARLMAIARQCGQTLQDNMNNLLDFSRLEAGRLKANHQLSALLPLLDQALRTIQSQAELKGLTLRCWVGEQVPFWLVTDACRLRQILINLLGNAVKFCAKGEISLEVRRDGEQLRFVICDSGRGIAPASQAAVFTAFYQLDHSIEGSGLGLPLARQLAQLLNGKLELESTPDIGTSVSLWLPLGEYHAPPPLDICVRAPVVLHRQLAAWGIRPQLPDPAHSSTLNDRELTFLPGKLYQQLTALPCAAEEAPLTTPPWRLRILLVDDAALNGEIMIAMLRRLGQQVCWAGNGRQALARGRQTRFDLVLMDICLPDISGIGCTRRWRSDSKNQDPDCMIVALSASTTAATGLRCQQAAIRQLLKPVSLAQLVECISLAAEYQLQRNIPLQEQYPTSGDALLSLSDSGLHDKITAFIAELFSDIENNFDDRTQLAALLHRLKGCLGQAGLAEPLVAVGELEQRLRGGATLQRAEFAALRQRISALLSVAR